MYTTGAQQPPKVAYFCMEYGLHEDFKIYAGGLGILAGDYLKSACDLGLPVVGIGILWRKGYTEQLIGKDGKPFDSYPCNSYNFLKDTKKTVNVTIQGRNVKCKIWMVDKYKNAPLYLLDANLPDNDDKWITERLYGGSSKDRIAQEIVLGIGGIRALRALNIDVDVYHFNEGHAVFAGIELIREKMTNHGLTFEEAVSSVRKEIVFTTHTPVREGNEAHNHDLLKNMGSYNSLSNNQMVTIGGDPFNMTVAGLRLAKIANAVAKLHGKTSNRMWKDVSGKAMITSVTNGVHPGSWQDKKIRQAYETNSDIWGTHMTGKSELLSKIYQQCGVTLDPNKILIGFARRAAPYKRSDMIFRNLDIIEPYLRSGQIQLVFSGKAHPSDGAGKNIVANLVEMMKLYPNSVVFIPNYNMEIGRMLTRGCDVWLNNPRRPNEASGTSGMKAAMNGVLNLSTLDGWWPEACKHGINGWQFGNGYEGINQDAHDLDTLYKTLFSEVLLTYYSNRDKWIQMMMESISDTKEKFSSDRMVKDYYNMLYIPTLKSKQAA